MARPHGGKTPSGWMCSSMALLPHGDQCLPARQGMDPHTGYLLFRDDVRGCVHHPGEEIAGPHASPHLGIVLALNLPWLLLPILLTIRLWKEHPFTMESGTERTFL